ncbi:MAG: DUF1186 domain-containing protein [Rhizomicrobium sp.]
MGDGDADSRIAHYTATPAPEKSGDRAGIGEQDERMDGTEKAELEAIRDAVRRRFPVATIIEALGSGDKPANAVLGAAVLLAAEIAPALLAAVEQAATGEALSPRQSWLAFYGLHILGGARDARVFAPLIRILHLPEDTLYTLLGDALTETVKHVAIGAFDGRAHLLFDLIADRSANEYARREMFGVLAFLAFEGRIEIAEAKRFILRFDEERLAPEGDMAWCGWEEAIALLGFRDLVPRVEAAWRDRRPPQGFSEPKYFLRDLKRAETAWGKVDRFVDGHNLRYIEDIAEELAWVSHADGGTEDASGRDADDFGAVENGGEPYVNPLRGIGRNDPCPCGSGKKAKRCCLGG